MMSIIRRRSVVALVGGAVLSGTVLAGSSTATAQSSVGLMSAMSVAAYEPTCTKYPLQYTHWYGRNDGTVRSHSGVNSADRPMIMRIQRTLNAAIAAELDVDGYYGPATATATAQFQRVLNDLGADPELYVDGKFGKRTFFAAADAGWWRTLCG